MRTALLTVLALSGCGWNHLPDQSTLSLDAPLWAPEAIVPVQRGLYVPLPETGHLAWVRRDGVYRRVGIRPAALDRLVASPDASRAVAFLERYRCDDEDLRHEAEYAADCPADRLEVEGAIALLNDNGEKIGDEIDIDNHFNSIAFSDDGTRAIAYLDLEGDETDVSGVVSVSKVLVIDLQDGNAWPVEVGFAADHALFTPDGTRAIILSHSKVAVVDLTLDPPATVVTFPLTLDVDEVVVPVGIALTPDGRYALISVQDRGDLYVLDLELNSVNLVSLPGRASAMWVDPGTDQTVLTYASIPEVDVLDHDYFELETLALDEPMNRIDNGEDFALLYSTGTGLKDVYRLDVGTFDLVEYRLQNPAVSMHLAPTEDYAVVLTRAEDANGDLYDQRPGMEILDLRPGEDDTFPYLLEAQGLGVAFVADESSLRALVLQQGVDYLFELDLYTGDSVEIELAPDPLSIGSLPGDGPFYVTHDSAFGHVSFYNPTTGVVTEVTGFATVGLLDSPRVQEEEE